MKPDVVFVKIERATQTRVANRLYVWYHGSTDEVSEALDAMGATAENPANLSVPMTPKGEIYIIRREDLRMIGGIIIDLN